MDLENNLDEVLISILFALGREISIEEFSNTLKVDREYIEDAINRIQEKFKNSGINLVKVNNSYQLVTNKDCYKFLKQFVQTKKLEKLSISCLEVLTIIAYNPKITKVQIEKIRGISSDYAVNKLLEYGLIEIVGKLDVIGKPRIYSVTNEFLKSVGVSCLEELPDYENLKYSNGEDITGDKQIYTELN